MLRCEQAKLNKVLSPRERAVAQMKKEAHLKTERELSQGGRMHIAHMHMHNDYRHSEYYNFRSTLPPLIAAVSSTFVLRVFVSVLQYSTVFDFYNPKADG